MLIVDVETGGLDPRLNPLLSIGAVEFENPTNQFYREIKPHKDLVIDGRALEVNGINLEEWKSKPSLFSVMTKFYTWIRNINEITLAGHNPSFDRDFCNINFHRAELNFIFNHRTIDLHSVAYTVFIQRKIKFDRLYSDEIYRLLGIREEPRPHNALNGAIWETEAFARLLYNKELGLTK